MRTKNRVTALAVAFALTAGISGLTIAPAFADDAVPADPPAEVVEAPAAAPAPEPAPAPAPAPEPAPAPAPEPAPEPAPAAEPPAEEPAPIADEAPPADAPEQPLLEEEPVEAPITVARTAKLEAATVAAAATNTKVTLCHATQGANPWISETIDEQAAFNGHVDPPNNKNDHLTDIIPPFQYKEKGNTITYPGKNLTTLFNGVPGSVILANDCKMPTIVTPAASATPQDCSPNNVLVDGRITVTIIPGVSYTITGPSGVVAYDPVSGQTAPVPPGTYSVAFTLTSPSVYTNVTSPIPVTVGAFTGPCSRTPVTPAAVAFNEDCVRSVLVDGSILVDVQPGVTYTITDSSMNTVTFDPVTGQSDPVPPGTYTVSFVVDPAYVTAVVSPIIVTVDPYSGVCGNVTQVAPAATPTPETCDPSGSLVDGRIQLTVIAGVTYTITDPSMNPVGFDAGTGLSDPVGPGTYSVGFTLDPGLSSSVTSPFDVVVDPYAGACVPPSPVTPAAFPTDQTCVANVFLTDGFIQLDVISGVNYTITGPGAVNVPFNAAGLTGPIPPGTYSIGFTLDPGYTTAVVSPFDVVVNPYGAACDLTTAPLVVAAVVADPATCSAGGSFTLSNDLNDPAALTWLADGNPILEGTHPVSAPDTVVITVSANGPSYGFNPGQQTTWTLDFPEPQSCGVGGVGSLAFTGSTPGASLAIAAVLVGLGAVLLIRRRREARIPG